ncbi:heterotrimeric G protein alpha subunit 4 [Mycena amicta]|nr:heterotrimeric G protein alpha subunit 4 [Mycena amicta]
MGACMSSSGVSEKDLQLHRDAEKELRIAKAKIENESKVLLLGSGDSGKSTVLKQMRLIHNMAFTSQETEHFRRLIFDNLTRGLKSLLDALPDLKLELVAESGYENLYPETDDEGRAGYVRNWAPGECGGQLVAATFKERLAADNVEVKDADGVKRNALAADLALIENPPDLRSGESFPLQYLGAILRLWADPIVREAWAKGHKAALPENLPYLISAIPRLFSSGYVPTAQDIVHARARTIGITETTFKVAGKEMLMVDVGGQKSERRKWIHCFQDVTSILFLASLSGYDQCLVEDRSANQMHDAMTIWDSICHSKWFKQTSIILFLNKDDLFQKKIKTSHIHTYFPEYEGPQCDADAGREWFRHRFGRLAQRGRTKQREIYVHITNATDTAMLRVVMAAVTASSCASICKALP